MVSIFKQTRQGSARLVSVWFGPARHGFIFKNITAGYGEVRRGLARYGVAFFSKTTRQGKAIQGWVTCYLRQIQGMKNDPS